MVRARSKHREPTCDPVPSVAHSVPRLSGPGPPLYEGDPRERQAQMKIVLPVLVALSLSACSALSARPIDGAKVQNIQQCTTSEQEVLSWFGSPGRRGTSGQYRSLTWRYSGSDEWGKIEQELIVFVNARGKVVSYAWNPTSPQVEVIDNCQR